MAAELQVRSQDGGPQVKGTPHTRYVNLVIINLVVVCSCNVEIGQRLEKLLALVLGTLCSISPPGI